MKNISFLAASLLLCGAALAQGSHAPAQPGSSHEAARAAAQAGSGREAPSAAAQPRVEGGWVRATIAGQQASGAYMRITAARPMQLVSVQTPAAGLAEVHEMKMDGSVMRMRAIDKLDLPAGTPVELKPGGYHLMLQQLKQPLAAGSTVALTLRLRDESGTESRVELKLPVLAQPPGGASNAPAATMHKH